MHKDEVWTFPARFDGAAKSHFPWLKAEAFVLNKKTDKWESRGIVMDNCWPYDDPLMVKQMKELEKESARLKKLLASGRNWTRRS